MKPHTTQTTASGSRRLILQEGETEAEGGAREKAAGCGGVGAPGEPVLTRKFGRYLSAERRGQVTHLSQPLLCA